MQHNTFHAVLIHTAKCDICNMHNRSVIFRCTDCGWQVCTPCKTARTCGTGDNVNFGGLSHGINMAFFADDDMSTMRGTGPGWWARTEEHDEEEETCQPFPTTSHAHGSDDDSDDEALHEAADILLRTAAGRDRAALAIEVGVSQTRTEYRGNTVVDMSVGGICFARADEAAENARVARETSPEETPSLGSDSDLDEDLFDGGSDSAEEDYLDSLQPPVELDSEHTTDDDDMDLDPGSAVAPTEGRHTGNNEGPVAVARNKRTRRDAEDEAETGDVAEAEPQPQAMPVHVAKRLRKLYRDAVMVRDMQGRLRGV